MKRKNIHDESPEYLREFLRSLNKLPAHYCRKETLKEYLEQFQSMAQLHQEYEKQCNIKGKKCLSITKLTEIVNELNIGIFTPRKDRCDECYKFENKNLEEDLFLKQCEEKDRARNEKKFYKNRAIFGDLQAVKICPQLKASSLYYKVKLCCHNFTIYDLATNLGPCYWFDETKTYLQASSYASCVVDYLKDNFLDNGDKREIIIFSDGCIAQNRNSIMSNALLHLAETYVDALTVALEYEVATETSRGPARVRVIRDHNNVDTQQEPFDPSIMEDVVTSVMKILAPGRDVLSDVGIVGN
ncbi:unnamed protein product [Psylliodes chrysocephalus]|uniref:Uncharacterized protein n=1 Tax=Psylliodes chrysocephalus TaxID=3402493 RepID=A0A9P0D1B8_9CUCU|nr:unnamed protein product [Psylliodes chrysocephala]